MAILALASGRNMWQTYSVCREGRSGFEESHTSFGNMDGQEEVLGKLQGVSKRDLLHLFLSSKCPEDLGCIRGEWNGILLNNNHVLTAVSRILTNSFFGRGRRWNGKAFYDSQIRQAGTNRFRSRDDLFKIETEHRFVYSIAPSRMDPRGSSVNLKYSKYQHLFSLWKTMVDELRMLQLPEKCPIEVLICMGCMGWSGGVLNASPFFLWRLKE